MFMRVLCLCLRLCASYFLRNICTFQRSKHVYMTSPSQQQHHRSLSQTFFFHGSSILFDNHDQTFSAILTPSIRRSLVALMHHTLASLPEKELISLACSHRITKHRALEASTTESPSPLHCHSPSLSHHRIISL